MTSLDSANASRPLRTAGTALLALAALSLVVGVVSLAGMWPASSTPPGSSALATPPGSGAGQPAATSPVPTQSRPGATSSVVPTQRVPVRVYNNSFIVGLGGRAADDLRNAGWDVVETGNYGAGLIATTTAYYRPGTDEEAAANQLGAAFHMRVEPRFDGIASASAGVIVIVTNDYKGLATK